MSSVHHFIGISCETENKMKDFAEHGWITFGLVNEEEYQKITTSFTDKICENSPWVDCYHQDPKYKLCIDESDQNQIRVLVKTFGEKWIIGADLFKLFCDKYDDDMQQNEDFWSS